MERFAAQRTLQRSHVTSWIDSPKADGHLLMKLRAPTARWHVNLSIKLMSYLFEQKLFLGDPDQVSRLIFRRGTGLFPLFQVFFKHSAPNTCFIFFIYFICTHSYCSVVRVVYIGNNILQDIIEFIRAFLCQVALHLLHQVSYSPLAVACLINLNFILH